MFFKSVFPSPRSQCKIVWSTQSQNLGRLGNSCGTMTHRYVGTISHLPKPHRSKEINHHQTEKERQTYTQMLPVKLMWGHRCGLHITATTAIFQTDISNILTNKTTDEIKQTYFLTLSVPWQLQDHLPHWLCGWVWPWVWVPERGDTAAAQQRWCPPNEVGLPVHILLKS